MKKSYAFLLSAAILAPAIPSQAAKLNRLKSASVSTPAVLPASEITDEGFTANWQPVPGADGYAVFVTSRQEVEQPGRYTLLYEDFNLISQGSVIEPVFIEETTSELSQYMLTSTPDWTISQCILAGGKVGGVIWTPYFDVRADGGKYRVTLTIMGYAGQEIAVTSLGSKEVLKKFTLADNGDNTVSLDFDNGTQDTFLRIVDNGFPDDTEEMYIDKIAYLDDIEVSQEFKAGDDIYRLVAVGESEENKLAFPKLPFAYGEKRLYYDLYATSFYYPDPEDTWNYEVDYSDFSPKQEVFLEGYVGIDAAETDGSAIAVDGNHVSCPGAFELFTPSGMKVASASGSTKAAPGIYLLRSAGKTTKIIVK